MKPSNCPDNEAASAKISKRIQELGDWRGKTLAHLRQLIHGKVKVMPSRILAGAWKMITARQARIVGQVASQEQLPLPADLDKTGQMKYDELSRLSGAEFDRAYTNVPTRR